MLWLVAREEWRSTPLGALKGEGQGVHQEAVVIENLGNHDNRGKQPSARRKVGCGLLCPQQPGR
jgi:hypothetical protein